MTAYADRILLGRHVFTGTGTAPIDGGVAILENRICAVGAKKELMPFVGPKTEVLDYGEGTILPGLHDDHVHFLTGCLYHEYPNLGNATSEEEAVEILRAFFDVHPDLLEAHSWALGFNWYNYWWKNPAFPTVASLDRAFPDTPVCLQNVDGHGVWVNSKALELCGVTKDTKEVPFGRIFRDQNGNPSGFFQEGAVSLIAPKAFCFSKQTEKMFLKKHLRYCSVCGITAVNDMQPFFGLELGRPSVYRELDEEGNLPIRLFFATDIFADAAHTRRVADAYSTGKVRHNGLKGFLDGVIVTHTSVMLDDYADDPSFNKFFPLSDYADMERKVIEYQKLGYPIHLHATGDGAVRFALDCYEKAQTQNGKTTSRLSIEHCDLVDNVDFRRFGELGIVASTQPPHIASADSYAHSLYRKTIGVRREQNLWAFRRLMENGAVLGVGTDYPVVDLNPREVIFSALERLFPDGTPEGGFNPGEKLQITDILRAYTYGGAYMCGQEEEIGTLEEGKLADVVVFDTDLFSMTDNRQILSSKVLLTICDGKVVYRGEGGKA